MDDVHHFFCWILNAEWFIWSNPGVNYLECLFTKMVDLRTWKSIVFSVLLLVGIVISNVAKYSRSDELLGQQWYPWNTKSLPPYYFRQPTYSIPESSTRLMFIPYNEGDPYQDSRILHDISYQNSRPDVIDNSYPRDHVARSVQETAPTMNDFPAARIHAGIPDRFSQFSSAGETVGF